VDGGCRWEREEKKSSWREEGTYKRVIERHLDWRVGADPPIGYVADLLARCFGMAEVKAVRRRRKAGFVGGGGRCRCVVVVW
jgi:hypothetical protein